MFSAEKKILSETEDKLVLRIPMIVGVRPVVVEPQAVFVALHVEDVRVAVTIGFCMTCHPCHRPPPPSVGEIGLYCFRDQKSTSASHQVFSFLKNTLHSLRVKFHLRRASAGKQ